MTEAKDFKPIKKLSDIDIGDLNLDSIPPNAVSHVSNAPLKPESGIKPYNVDRSLLKTTFLKEFKLLNGYEFVLDKHSNGNLQIILDYFARHEDFFKSDRLDKWSTPSLEKGLLIFGRYGCGKTSMMQTFHSIFNKNPGDFNRYYFGYQNAREMVLKYEALTKPADKQLFFSQNSNSPRYFDDVKKEKEASNYGKKNLFIDIFNNRYNRKIKTYITANYNDTGTEIETIENGLAEFRQKYTPFIFDRMPQMFNVIDFKGQTRRK